MKDQINVSDKTRLNIPIANFVVIVSIIVSSVYGFSNLQNRITSLETADKLMNSDLLKRADQTPKNLEIFMLLEELFKQTDKQQILLDNNIHTFKNSHSRLVEKFNYHNPCFKGREEVKRNPSDVILRTSPS